LEQTAISKTVATAVFGETFSVKKEQGASIDPAPAHFAS
jgi:hypothetical protein